MKSQPTRHQLAKAAQMEAQRRINSAAKDAEFVPCGACGGLVFAMGYRIKKLSRLATGQPNDMLFRYESYYCTKCGAEHVSAEAESPLLEGKADEAKE